MPSSSSGHRCWAEVDLAAIARNARFARDTAASRIMAVVKANAYGHGLVPVGRALESEAAFIGVATLEEALELQPHLKAGTPVFLLGPALPAERSAVAEHGIVPGLSTLEEARDYDSIAGRLGKRIPAHLVIDTGMGRMGFTEETLPVFLDAHSALGGLQIDGVASHLSCAGEDPAFTAEQIGRFERHLAECSRAGLSPAWVHLLNSAGILGLHDRVTLPGEARHLTRPGLMLYGVSPVPGKEDDLTPALELKTRIALLRELPRGSAISYGRTHITSRATTRVATLAVGYGDGFPRHLSGHGAEVLIRGRRCPLIGRVTMDQVLVDVTELPTPPGIGDEAVLIGRQESEFISAAELAEKAGTIPWEILTGITARVPRIYLQAGQS